MKFPNPTAAAAAAAAAAAGATDQQQQQPGVLLPQQPPHNTIKHVLDTLVTSYGRMQVGGEGLNMSSFEWASLQHDTQTR
jgi:hypothetical protein